MLLFFSIPAALPLLHPGFFHFSDEPHIANLYEMIRSISSGQFPPRFAPDMSWGYGYPLFNFYYPLPFYVGALFFSFTGSLIQSLKLVFLISILVSPIGMFLWLKKHTENINAFAGSLIYLYTPYRAVDLYVRGALGECAAFAVIPFLFLFTFNIVEKSRWRDIGLLGISVGVLILSHNLAPLLFLPILIGYSLVLVIQKKNYKNILHVFSGILLGLCISAYFWLPALLEKGLLVQETPFNYVDHFPFIKQLIYSPFKYGASVWGPYDDISFQTGIVNLLLIGLSCVFLFKTKKKNIRLLWGFLIVVFIAALFLMNIRSTFLWELFSLSAYIQFPWRLLMITTFITSAFVIFVDKRISLFMMAAAMILTVTYFQPSEYFYPDDNYFLQRFFANRGIAGETQTVSPLYKNYSEDYLLLPKWIGERPIDLPAERIMANGIGVRDIQKNSDISYEISLGEFTKDQPAYVDIYHYYFPGWTAKSNGKNLDISIAGEDGHMRIENVLPNSSIKLYWEEIPLRKIADGISLVGLILAITLFVNKRLSFWREPASSGDR